MKRSLIDKVRALAEDERAPKGERESAALRLQELGAKASAPDPAADEDEWPTFGDAPRGPHSVEGGPVCGRCQARRCWQRPGRRFSPCICSCHYPLGGSGS